jgi:ketosteroid isomerase-like protein
MSHENVEMVRRVFEAYNRGGPDAAEPYWASDIEMFDAPEFPDAGRHVGASGVREMLKNYKSMGWDGRFEVQEYIDADPEVIVAWRMTAVGSRFGTTVTQVFFDAWLLKDGRVKRIRQFLSREQALEAHGLRE